MSKLFNALALASILSFHEAIAYVSYAEILERCIEQSLEPELASPRNAWARKCFPQHSDTFDYFAPKRPIRYALVYSPTRNSWDGPLDPQADCGDWQLKTFCIAACYTPDQRLLFEHGYVPIAEAQSRNLSQVTVLRKGSSIHAPLYDQLPIRAFSRSWKDSWEKIRIIRTVSGGVLKVTQNHPILIHSGSILEAAQLSVGNLLIKSDGTPDSIQSIEDQAYFGRVYNVEPQSEDPQENILVAEGYLVGSAGYQYHPELHRLVQCSNVSLK